MKARIYILTAAVLTVFAISVVAYADGPSEASRGGPMMGGGGNGGMGGHGGMGGQGMMGWGRGISALWEALSKKLMDRNQNTYDKEETGRLRKQIREKRRELASLLRSNNPEKKLIDQNIDELNRLESELDEKMTASYGER